MARRPFSASLARSPGPAPARDRAPRSRASERAWSRARTVLVAAAAVVVVAAGPAGWALRPGSAAARTTAPAASPALRTADLVTSAHQDIGTVYLHWNAPVWMFVTVGPGAVDSTVTCQLTTWSGRLITVGSFTMIGGDGYWGSPEPVQPTAVTAARLLSMTGAVLATDRFTAQPASGAPSR